MKKSKSLLSSNDELQKEKEDAIDNVYEYNKVLIVGKKKNVKIIESIIDLISKQYKNKLLSVSLDGRDLELVWDKNEPEHFRKKDIASIEKMVNSKISITHTSIDRTKAIKQLNK
ncbi:MAG: hypothetical protein HND40_15965 [Ignavibacteriota bacterium]|nr:hypothetical protein [Ignavibacteriota bacterium]MCO6448908.1 hypothetical protein [Ignavibacterium album]MCZ2267842.1 hypothetical protein [Ignavibacteriales bacterium]QKK00956.1 MAG: hypothetical protein HND40_15965 [Ignavibacteriota bacterium]HOJ07774.1 hypothetical protein [Ignavibacteriaceae bacterium]